MLRLVTMFSSTPQPGIQDTATSLPVHCVHIFLTGSDFLKTILIQINNIRPAKEASKFTQLFGTRKVLFVCSGINLFKKLLSFQFVNEGLDPAPVLCVRIRIRPKRSASGFGRKGPNPDSAEKVRIRIRPKRSESGLC